jgi:hypothetical protein
MWFAYLDESKEDNKFIVYTAVIVDAANWTSAFAALKNLRQTMKVQGGIYIRKELHAWKFASGKDEPLLRLRGMTVPIVAGSNIRYCTRVFGTAPQYHKQENEGKTARNELK